MFSTALEIAGRFTFPYVGLRRKHDGVVFSTLASIVVVNREGWALTSAHVLDEIARAEASIRGADKLAEEIPAARRRKASAEAAELKRKRDSSLSHHIEIWALPGFAASHPRVVEYHVDKGADIAAVRIEPFEAGAIDGWPVFRAPEDPVLPGISVCRLGYPFHSVEATFDEERKSFDITSGFPIPRFALDGIVSRFHALRVEGRQEPASFIETSTPGLRGQSGGPLLDVRGRVCGLQSHTAHLDLGFDASFEREGETVVERQFLNVGRAAHVDSLRAFMDEHAIAYESE